MTDTDPFRHHPELRALVKDPAQSFFRTFTPSEMDEIARANDMPADWRYTDEERNRRFDVFLDSLEPGDLWVFAYGSLIWDPGAHFVEIRKCFAPGYARKFILVDKGARGTKDCPAVMAALDTGDGCHGAVFRLASDTLRDELEYIWRREQIAPAYHAVMIDVETDFGTVKALTFVANYADRDIEPDLSFDAQVTALATAEGAIGTNFEYIDNLKRQFDALKINDPHLDELYAAARKMAQECGTLS